MKKNTLKMKSTINNSIFDKDCQLDFECYLKSIKKVALDKTENNLVNFIIEKLFYGNNNKFRGNKWQKENNRKEDNNG